MGLAAPAPTPKTRKAGTPRIAATAAVTRMASNMLSQKFESPTLVTMTAAVYAPTPKKAAWPKLGMFA